MKNLTVKSTPAGFEPALPKKTDIEGRLLPD